MALHCDKGSKALPASTLGAKNTSLLQQRFADTHRRFGRALRVLELGSVESQPVASSVAADVPIEVLGGDSSETPDVVLIHPQLSFSAIVQALYAVRSDLALDATLCGLCGEQGTQWPVLKLVLEHFVEDFHVENGFWIARPSGLAFLKCLPPYAEVEHLVAQVESDLSTQEVSRQSEKLRSDLTPEAVSWAFRVLLGREPTDDETSETIATFPNMDALRADIARGAEFKKKNSALLWMTFSGNESPMHVEMETSHSDHDALLAHIRTSWEHLGETEPHWSVLTAEQYKQQNIEHNEVAFYQTGKGNAETLFRTLERNGIDPSSLKTCLEYGCGLGRVTRWLAERFENVHGYDISRAHLEGARQYLARQGISNVSLHNIAEPKDLTQLEAADLVYSVIVLQHNPPPVIALILRSLLATLRPGGIAFFQVPTYQRGYYFSSGSYLSRQAGKRGMEMHVLPQAAVFALAEDSGSRVLEVFEDRWTGIVDGGRSNTFVLRKN